MSTQQYKFYIEKVKILKTTVIDRNYFYGVFLHRELNMPEHCYSLEEGKKKGILYQINNLERSLDLQRLQEKKMLYLRNSYSQFYVDSYDNYVMNE